MGLILSSIWLRPRIANVECDVAPRHLTICECRPPWREDLGPGHLRAVCSVRRDSRPCRLVEFGSPKPHSGGLVSYG
jgi:hypothetical protein